MGGVNRVGHQVNIEHKPELAVKKAEVKVEIAEVTFKDSKTGDSAFQASLLKDQLTRTFDAPLVLNSAPPVIDQAKVDDAVKIIKDRLNESITDWDVTHGDLTDIQNAVKGLNSNEANAAFGKLSGKDLEKWADELSGLNGGFSRDEKKVLFDDLAGKLDGANLARFAAALGKEGGSVEALSQSIAAKASPQAKIDFVKNSAAEAEKNPAVAKAIAEVIGGLQNDPAALSQAVGALSDKQMASVMEAATVTYTNSSAGEFASTSIDFDAQALNKMLGAVATSNDPALKARVFNAASTQLKSIEETSRAVPFRAVIGRDAAAAQVRDGLTKIINSDTVGVIQELEQNNNGDGLKSYVKSMLNTGEKADQDQIGNQIARLLGGNDLSQNQIDRFEQQMPGTTGKLYNQNARSLGFYAGAIHAATKSITGDRAEQANLIKNVFGTAAGIVGAKNPITGAVANGLTTQLVDGVVKKMDNQSYDVEKALLDLTLPHGGDGRIYTGPARDSYDAAFAATAERNEN